MNIINNYKVLALLSAIFCFVLYWPAMNGPFLFDDMSNLAALQLNGGIHNFQNWLDFVFGGKSATGRPLALATFTLNAQNWPTDALPFKITNVLIHLFNSYLLFKFLTYILEVTNSSTTLPKYIPILFSVIWLIHPIHLTTILQVVQRMTLLAGTFTLLALITYTKFFIRFRIGANKDFYKLLAILTIYGLLGIMCKEIVILLPLYFFALNYTVFSFKINLNNWIEKSFHYLLLTTPFIFIFISTIVLNERLDEMWKIRDYNLYEKILTEFNVLISYIKILFIPTSSGSSLFHDNIQISRSFLDIKTILSFTSILILIFIAVISRKKYVFLSLAIIWFFLGHSIEAFILPIELFFEHRNYIPSFSLLFILLQVYLTVRDKYLSLVKSLIAVYTFLFAVVTGLTTNIWADKFTLMDTWARENPNSVRAQQEGAYVWLYLRKDPVTARNFLIKALNANPNSTSTRIRLLQINCYFEKPIDDKNILIQRLDKTNFEFGAIASISSIIKLYEDSLCLHYTPNFLINLLTKLERNPKFSSKDDFENIYFRKAKLYFLLKQYDQAVEWAKKAYSITEYVGTAVFIVEALLEIEEYSLAKEYLEQAIELDKMNTYYVSPETNAKLKKFRLILK